MSKVKDAYPKGRCPDCGEKIPKNAPEGWGCPNCGHACYSEQQKIECPVCHATLIHKRVDDGFDTHKISKNGKVTPLASKSNGYDEVYCSKNLDHIIPDDLVIEVLDLVSRS